MAEPMINWTRRTALSALGASSLVPLTSAAGASATLAERSSLEGAVNALRLAMVEGDRKSLNALLHDELSYIHSSGHVQSKQNVLSDLAGKTFFASLTYTKSETRITGDVGVVTLVVDQVKNLPGGGTRASRLNVMQIWLHTRRAWTLLARSSALVAPAAAPPAPIPPRGG